MIDGLKIHLGNRIDEVRRDQRSVIRAEETRYLDGQLSAFTEVFALVVAQEKNLRGEEKKSKKKDTTPSITKVASTNSKGDYYGELN